MFRLVTVLAVVLAAPVFGGESVCLTTGMRMHIDRHEEAGETVRLYRGATVIEMPRSTVTAFEPDEEIPTAAAAVATVMNGSSAASETVLASEPVPAIAAPDLKAHDLKAPDPRAMVRAAAERAGLPAAFVESVAKTESAFNPTAISSKGAIGVMQLMPETAKAMGADPNDPTQNIEAGAQLLRGLLLKYNGDVVKALAAYNAGEGAVDRYQGVPPYPETQHYVNTVVRDYLKGAGDHPKGTAQ